VRVPAGLLSAGATLLGRPGIARRLCGSLQVDTSKTRAILGWQPCVTVDEGLKGTVRSVPPAR
jgi:nucleoside-diphosphate-sugar epimerase